MQKNPNDAKSVEQALQPPGKFEITSDSVFTVDVNLAEHRGRWVVVDKTGVGIESYQVVFRIWTFEEMLSLRKRATSYDPQKRANIVDVDLLNRLKIQRLLKSWTFDRDNPRLKLLHVNGILSDESWKAFTRLAPNIAEYIINQMNLVLDYGG